MRRVLAVLLVIAAPATAATPVTQNPMGPIIDVTASWQDYQPATDFCIKPDVFEFAPQTADATGADPVCAASGFAPSTQRLIKIHVVSPPLCEGCRRLFIDYSKIPVSNAPPYWYAHGHTYFKLVSLNPGMTVGPEAHSPNVKNLSNDKLFVPDGSPWQPAVEAFDENEIFYTGNTYHFVHTDQQGPYYTGRWYLSQSGVRVAGAYLDVSVPVVEPIPSSEIGYWVTFHSGEQTCPDELYDRSVADGDGYYGGCVDHAGSSASAIA